MRIRSVNGKLETNNLEIDSFLFLVVAIFGMQLVLYRENITINFNLYTNF